MWKEKDILKTLDLMVVTLIGLYLCNLIKYLNVLLAAMKMTIMKK